jgi:hypothetical protein
MHQQIAATRSPEREAVMGENARFSCTRIVFLISCYALLLVMFVLAGCSSKETPTGSSNGVSAPVDLPENSTYSNSVVPLAFILVGIDAQIGYADPLGEFAVRILDANGAPPPPSTPVEIRWNVSDYPDRVVCAGYGTSVSLVNGVYKLSAYTNSQGWAYFRQAGYFSGSVACSGGDADTVRKGRLYVNGDLQDPPAERGGWFLVAAADLNDTSGVDEDDEDLCSDDIACGSLYFSRSDYNGDRDVTSADLSILVGIASGGGSGGTCNE